jgi:peptide/nickel transport system substrate-binding protein
MFKKFLLVLLALATTLTVVGCKKKDDPIVPVEEQPKYETKTVETGINDEYTLVLQSSEMDGVFNPFFYSSAYDGDVIDLVNSALLQLESTGAVVAGDKYPTVALDYSIYYTNNIATYAKKDSYTKGDYVVYEMVIKNGAKFSDGTAITADDVLFNYYTYLDPAYQGSSTLYTLPIRGLKDYRTQVVNADQYTPVLDALYADQGYGKEYAANTEFTKDQFDKYWDYIDEFGTKFAQEIVDYVMKNYGSDAYVNKNFAEGHTIAEVKASEGLKIAFGMSMWGFGGVSADLTKFTAASETVYDVDDLTAKIYFEEIIAAYTDENGKVDMQEVSDTETAGSDFVGLAKENFVKSYSEVGSVPNITGLVKGTTKINNVDHETIKIVLTEQNPKAILSLGVTVAPKHYYTAGYTYKAAAIKNFGVEFNSKEFMDHLESYNAAPMGAGTYKFVSRDSGDGTVKLERNTYFETMGGDNVYNANIKNVAFKVVDSGAEFNALDAKSVHYATVSATADVMVDITTKNFLQSITVDNLGYGYICVNPEVYSNLHERIAITSVFDLAKVYEYYPNGLADVIYRSQSQVSWAYPEGAKAIYPYDESLATAVSEFKAAGYVYDEATKKFTGVETIAFTIPSAADAHPAGRIFLKAKDLLETIGITAEVKTDANLIANIKKGAVGIYALAWQSSADPDMYQVYHYNSAAESVISNGVKWLHENGTSDDLGTIEVVKLDGAKVVMNQTAALNYLGQLIEDGTKYMLAEERAPIYSKALEILAQLSIEIATYQRKNLFAFNSQVIDSTTVSNIVTPYWGPLTEIWKLKFTAGTIGNQTKQIQVPIK